MWYGSIANGRGQDRWNTSESIGRQMFFRWKFKAQQMVDKRRRVYLAFLIFCFREKFWSSGISIYLFCPVPNFRCVADLAWIAQWWKESICMHKSDPSFCAQTWTLKMKSYEDVTLISPLKAKFKKVFYLGSICIWKSNNILHSPFSHTFLIHISYAHG